jgi:SAM-dependent methyltransferase
VTGPLHFDRTAEDYAAARPPYPAELWRDVFATGLVAPGRKALDLGSGTGEAIGPLLDRGMRVVAIEPGAQLAKMLAKRHFGAVVHRVRAEEVQPEDGAFDLVIAATSFHWLDTDAVLPIIHRSLNADGRLLVWRNVFGDEAAQVTPFRRAVELIVSRREGARSGNPESLTATAEELTRSGLFSIEATRRYRWTIELTADQVRRLFGTFSDWSRLEVEQAAKAVTALGGVVTEHYASWLIVASPNRSSVTPG